MVSGHGWSSTAGGAARLWDEEQEHGGEEDFIDRRDLGDQLLNLPDEHILFQQNDRIMKSLAGLANGLAGMVRQVMNRYAGICRYQYT